MSVRGPPTLGKLLSQPQPSNTDGGTDMDAICLHAVKAELLIRHEVHRFHEVPFSSGTSGGTGITIGLIQRDCLS